MPVERHRVARLAGESVLRLLQQSIPLSRGKGRRLFARDGVGDFGLREAGAGPPLEAPGRELGVGSTDRCGLLLLRRPRLQIIVGPAGLLFSPAGGPESRRLGFLPVPRPAAPQSPS